MGGCCDDKPAGLAPLEPPAATGGGASPETTLGAAPVDDGGDGGVCTAAPCANEASPKSDPVCGMTVAADGVHRFEHDGRTYIFCCAGCRNKFAADPEKWLNPREPEPGMAAVEHTCPMHPEVQQMGPGPCPDCGMALEPMGVSLDAEQDSEVVAMQQRLYLALPLGAILFAVSMGDMLPGSPVSRWLGEGRRAWLEALLATPVVLGAGWVFLERAVASFRRRKLNMFSLIGMGVTVSYGYSWLSLLWPGWLSGSDRNMGLYFESAALIVCFVLIGQVIEGRARGKTGQALRGLLSLRPETALRIDADGDAEIALDEVAEGDRLRVLAGQQIPVDGRVIEGRSEVDEAWLSGEAIPQPKVPGARLHGASINGSGTLVMRAEAVGKDTLLSRVVQQVAAAQRSRAPVQQAVDRASALFVPLVLGVALLSFVSWFVFAPADNLSLAVQHLVAVLLVACPCALGLATPMAILVGVGRGAEHGLLFRDAAALEELGRVDVLGCDKTGTLTHGRPRVVAECPKPSEVALACAAGLAHQSHHPLARALADEARQRNLSPLRCHSVETVAGRGILGRDGEGNLLRVGNAAFMHEHGLRSEAVAGELEAMTPAGASMVFVARGNEVLAGFGLSDSIRPEAQAAVADLRAADVEVVLLSGDRQHAVDAVKQALGIDAGYGDLLPSDKAAKVQAWQAAGKRVALAGDGINDAPALALANVGIAMGSGSDMALETAGVALVDGNLRALGRGYQLSRAVGRNIRQNLLLAFGYNLLALPLAAGALQPLWGIELRPMWAALAMSLSSVCVIANSLRLRNA